MIAQERRRKKYGNHSSYFIINLRFCLAEAFEIKKASITRAPEGSFDVSRTRSSSKDVMLIIND